MFINNNSNQAYALHARFRPVRLSDDQSPNPNNQLSISQQENNIGQRTSERSSELAQRLLARSRRSTEDPNIDNSAISLTSQELSGLKTLTVTIKNELSTFKNKSIDQLGAYAGDKAIVKAYVESLEKQFYSFANKLDSKSNKFETYLRLQDFSAMMTYVNGEISDQLETYLTSDTFKADNPNIPIILASDVANKFGVERRDLAKVFSQLLGNQIKQIADSSEMQALSKAYTDYTTHANGKPSKDSNVHTTDAHMHGPKIGTPENRSQINRIIINRISESGTNSDTLKYEIKITTPLTVQKSDCSQYSFSSDEVKTSQQEVSFNFREELDGPSTSTQISDDGKEYAGVDLSDLFPSLNPTLIPKTDTKIKINTPTLRNITSTPREHATYHVMGEPAIGERTLVDTKPQNSSV